MKIKKILLIYINLVLYLLGVFLLGVLENSYIILILHFLIFALLFFFLLKEKYKIFFGIIFSFVFIIFFSVFFQYFKVINSDKIDYFNSNNISKSDISRQINYISKNLHNKNYGITGALRGELLSHTFYGYSLVNIYLQNKDENFRKFAVNQLEFIYNYILTDGKNNFKNNKTKLEYGIIYQGHKNMILAGLVILGEDKYRDEFYKNSDFLALDLEKSQKYTAETYEGWAWYVDNINAYYSLYICDKFLEKEKKERKYENLINNWLKVLKENVDKKGFILTETYSPNIANNQARGPALAWLLTYLKDLDYDLYKNQNELFYKYFVGNVGKFSLVRDVPLLEETINKVQAGPIVNGYSSSATILSLALFKSNGDKENFTKLLDFLNFALYYNKDNYIFGKSLLLDSLILWGKTYVSWGENI